MRVVVSAAPLGNEPTGPQVHLTSVLRELLALDPELRLTLRYTGLRNRRRHDLPQWLVNKQVEVRHTPVPVSVLRPAQALLRQPAERLLIGPYDVYHQFNTDSDPAVPADKLIVTLHDTVALHWPREEGAMYRGAGRLLRRAVRVLTVSEFSKTAICEEFGVHPEAVRVVGNGVDHDRFRPLPEADRTRELRALSLPTARFLLYVGGSTPRKNVPRILAAFAEVRRTPGCGDVHLVLAGPVRRAEVELRHSLPADLPQESLHFLDYVPASAMPSLYGAAQALVYPSLYEGFGLPVLEAMACGTAVVTSAVSALPEVSGGHAILTDPRDTESVVEGIVLALDEHAAGARRAAALHWAQGFTWERTARAVLETYHEIQPGRVRY